MTNSLDSTRLRNLKEKGFKLLFLTCAIISIITTLAIIYILVSDSISFFSEIPITEFLLGTEWYPTMMPQEFGVLPLLAGTIMITVGAAIVAIPLGVATAVYLSEYADKRLRKIIKPILEVLAGIPTIVYGFFALTFITPILQNIFPDVGIFNAASASIVVGIMILPMISSLSEDAINAVPDEIKRGGYALGATKLRVTTNITIPAALSGILSSFILGISRAIGETMAVTIAAGRTPNITANPFESIQTMTSAMVEIGSSDVAVGSLPYQSLFAVGLLLFIITLLMNMVSQYMKSKYQEVYD
ncbi:ABC-type phosphate transport system permease component [Methanonatronarchaeum thermophilum]|uniref:Phosphate transport system permease protein n=1 Tax=Methanonatronarchaeum thermophilum TaxID=1927129 RepID=A0A1Y3GCM0_9EURY|nr:phosphate ABC transporter permease subunit PstC [Methanonatronarchaeum thermophilum]OUJ18997.1 ABC-type phosphate transport system permease component [Methanonatronarchaeum thermophilum]